MARRRKKRASKKAKQKSWNRLRAKISIFVFSVAFIVGGCQLSVKFNSDYFPSKQNASGSEYDPVDYSSLNVDQKWLLNVADDWLGTPYRFGGTTKSGVDCSGFVQNVYKSIGINLPRTSSDQYAFTRRISKDDLKIGDLVFFRRTARISHVGIYIGNNYMIHASTSRGVIKESLDEDHLQKNFAGFGRVG